MTAAQKKGLQIGLQIVLAVLGLVGTAAFSAGLARNELTGKEDASAHAADISALRSEAQLQRVRDSAQIGAVFTIVRDVACDQNPRRSYCGRAP